MSTPVPKIIVLCDGTWCGPSTGTDGNIWRIAQILAEKIGAEALVKEEHTETRLEWLFGVNELDLHTQAKRKMTIYNGKVGTDRGSSIRYYEGVGTTGSMAEYRMCVSLSFIGTLMSMLSLARVLFMHSTLCVTTFCF
jgi:hypothetical protein